MITLTFYPLLIAWLITHFEPVTDFFMETKYFKWLTCFKCVSLWTTLIYSIIVLSCLNPYMAILNAIIATFYSQYIYKNNIEL